MSEGPPGYIEVTLPSRCKLSVHVVVPSVTIILLMSKQLQRALQSFDA